MSPLTASVIMIVLATVIIAWDIWLAIDRRDENTISERVRAADRRFVPFKHLLTFGFGLLTGHWFWAIVFFVSLGTHKIA